MNRPTIYEPYYIPGTHNLCAWENAPKSCSSPPNTGTPSTSGARVRRPTFPLRVSRSSTRTVAHGINSLNTKLTYKQTNKQNKGRFGKKIKPSQNKKLVKRTSF